MPDRPDNNPGSVRTLLYRMARSARFDGQVFRSLREDHKATGQSILVLGLAGLCFGIGTTVSSGSAASVVFLGAVVGAILSILLGFIWLTLNFLIGTRLLGGTSSYWGLARPLFFSVSPGLLFLLMLIPVSPIPGIARGAVLAWIAVASVFAVRNGLGIETQRSMITFIIAGLIMIVVYTLIVSLVAASPSPG